MKNVYIHGASATHESFNYIRQKIGKDSDIVIDYDSRNGFEKNLSNIKEILEGEEKIFFIAHSLGGIYSLHLASRLGNNVLGAVTLSTPYGGAEVADFAQFFLPFSRLMRDIGPTSWAMKQAKEIKIQHPWTNIVTVKGQSPFLLNHNDGVVTIASQKKFIEDMELVEVDCNHYEVVLSEPVIDIIKERIKKFRK